MDISSYPSGPLNCGGLDYKCESLDLGGHPWRTVVPIPAFQYHAEESAIVPALALHDSDLVRWRQ